MSMIKTKNFEKWFDTYAKNTYGINIYNELVSRSQEQNEVIYESAMSLNIISYQELMKLAVDNCSVPFIDLEEFEDIDGILNLLPKEICEKYLIIPLPSKDKSIFMFATSKPNNLTMLDDLKVILKNKKIVPIFAFPSRIQLVMNELFSNSKMDEILEELKEIEIEVKKETEIEEKSEDLEEESSVIKMVNSILYDAVSLDASDVHIEPLENSIRVRYRVDGMLIVKIEGLNSSFLPPITSRIKILGTMNIAEQRKPQDGRFKVGVGNKTVDVRVSTMPTQYGEKIVMRLTSKTVSISNLENLGFSNEESEVLRNLVKHPYGLLLTTGPTGSGKSTTLYGLLSYVNSLDKNIVTIEDPIERQIKGVIQTSINEKIGVTFSTGLKTILRQDPDIIMVGEMRDFETADMTIQAALTGHLVLSTLHTNDASGAIPRLKDMGIESFKIPSAVLGVLAQRLLRKNCPNCTEKHEATQEELILIKSLNPNVDTNEKIVLSKGKGCKYCGGTGYKGREALFELLILDEELRQLVLDEVPSQKIKSVAISKGMIPMEQKAITKVLEGRTSLEEVKRVIFV